MNEFRKKSHLKIKKNPGYDIEHIIYYDFFKNANDIILIIDTEGNIIDVNNRALETYGYSLKEFKNFKLFDLRSPDEKEISKKQLNNIILKGSIKFESKHIKKSGEIFPIEVSSNIIKLKNKKIIQSIVRDISDRKKAEEALLKSERRYHILAENSPVGIFHTDANGYTTYVNTKWSEISGMTAEEAYGNGWLNSVHPEDKKLLISMWKEQVKNKNISKAEYRYLKKDGSVVWVIGQANPEKDYNGNVISYVGTITDITERKKTEELLSKSEEKFRNLIETMPEGFYRSTPEGYFIDVNPALVKMLGYSNKEELMKIHIPSQLYIKEEERDIKTDKNENFVNDYEIYRLRKKDGSEIWLEDYSRYIRDDMGKVIIHEGICHDITERKYAVEELKRKENQQSLILKSLPVVFYRVKPDASLATVWISEQVNELTGYIPEQFTNDSLFWSKHIHPEDYKKAIEEYESVFEKGSSKTEYRWQCADGTFRWFSDYIVMAFDEIGKPKEAIGFWIDINEQKISEQALRESDERYNSFINTNNDLIFVKDDNLKYIIANKATLSFFDKNREDIINKTDYDLMDEQSADSCKASDMQTLEKGAITVSLERIKDRIYESTKFPMKLKNNKIGIGAIIRDITERKKAEEKLKQSIENWNKTFNAIQDGIALLDANQHIIQCNQPFLDIVNKTIEEVLEKPCFYFVYETNCLIEGCPYKSTEISKKRETMEIEINGSICEILIDPILDDKENIIGAVHIISDITERKNIEKVLHEAKEKAEEASKIKTNFLANMSHELRTPMTGILGFAEILSDSLKDDDDKYKAQVILKGGHRLMNTLNLILDLSRIEADRIEVKMQLINLSSLVEESVNLFEIFAKEKNLELKTNIDENIYAILDEQLTEQVLANLIKNALIYTEKGYVSVELKSNNEGNNEFAEIKVTDTGIGIPENLIDVIFEPFRQVSEGHSREFEGTGLGLTLVKKYVEHMNGTVSVVSKVGNGSTFTIKFPVITDRKKEGIDFPKEETKKIITNNISGNKLLIAEDDENSRLAFEYTLKDICEIDFTDNGTQVIEMIKAKKYDIIIMDIDLKGIDGIDAIKKIREIKQYEKTPIIAVTAFVMDGDKEKFLKSGCSHYILKPFNLAKFKNYIQGLLNK